MYFSRAHRFISMSTFHRLEHSTHQIHIEQIPGRKRGQTSNIESLHATLHINASSPTKQRPRSRATTYPHSSQSPIPPTPIHPSFDTAKSQAQPNHVFSPKRKNNPPLPKRRPTPQTHQHDNIHPRPLLPAVRYPSTVQTPTRLKPLHSNHPLNNFPRPRRRPTLRHRNYPISVLGVNFPRPPSTPSRPCDPAHGRI
jgi:hypothetical protein